MEVFEVTNLDDIKKIIKDNIVIKNSEKSVHYLGLGYIKALADYINDHYPRFKIKFILDCDDDSAQVQAAISMGFKDILFKGDQAYRVKLEQIAKKVGVNLN